MCNGCRHGFTCCAYDGFHCGCGTELSMACSGEYCHACDIWFDPDLGGHDHDDPDFEDPPYGDADGPMRPVT